MLYYVALCAMMSRGFLHKRLVGDGLSLVIRKWGRREEEDPKRVEMDKRR